MHLCLSRLPPELLRPSYWHEQSMRQSRIRSVTSWHADVQGSRSQSRNHLDAFIDHYAATFALCCLSSTQRSTRSRAGGQTLDCTKDECKYRQRQWDRAVFRLCGSCFSSSHSDLFFFFLPFHTQGEILCQGVLGGAPNSRALDRTRKLVPVQQYTN